MRNVLAFSNLDSRRASMVMAVVVAGSSLLTAGASAATLLEFDFSNGASGTDVTASAVKNPAASSTASLNGTATVTTGAVNTLPGGVSNFIPGVGNGYLNIPRANGNDSSGLVMKHTTGTNAEYRDYLAGSAGYSNSSYWGTSTVLLVYQPNNANMASQRHTLFSANASGTSSSGFALYTTANASNSMIQMDMGQGTNLQGTVSIAAPTWDTSKWYVIAASWTVGGKVTLFWQELTADPATGTGHTAESANNLINGADVAANFGIGVRKRQSIASGDDDLYNENAEGKISYFLWTDQYTSGDAQYGSLVNGLYTVPELSSLTLLGSSALLLLRRRGK